MQDTPVKNIRPLSQREEEIGKIIVNAAYKVHSRLGPGHLHLMEKRLGYLINFNVALIKNGIKRFVI